MAENEITIKEWTFEWCWPGLRWDQRDLLESYIHLLSEDDINRLREHYTCFMLEEIDDYFDERIEAVRKRKQPFWKNLFPWRVL